MGHADRPFFDTVIGQAQKYGASPLRIKTPFHIIPPNHDLDKFISHESKGSRFEIQLKFSKAIILIQMA